MNKKSRRHDASGSFYALSNLRIKSNRLTSLQVITASTMHVL